MADNTGGDRTLISAIIPPGAAHVNGIFSVGDPEGGLFKIVDVAGFASSLLIDLSVRTVPKSGIYEGVFNRLPVVFDHPLLPELRLRTLRLNCVARSYAELWRACFSYLSRDDKWAVSSDLGGSPLALATQEWSASTPLRVEADRRRALVEIDSLVAIMLGVNADELCGVYRGQFSLLFEHDRNSYRYDANGRLVPTSVIQAWKRKGDAIDEDERTATNASGYTYTYELPFRTLDREHDMRVAYAEFERRLAQRA